MVRQVAGPVYLGTTNDGGEIVSVGLKCEESRKFE